MKKLLFISCLLITTIGFSQEKEWGSVKGNKLTLKEIAPVWPGCEGKSGSAIDACFKQKLAQHIGKNFKYPTHAYKKNEQGRVIVEFLITEQGTVDIKNVSGASKILREEAKRNILSIPIMAKSGIDGWQAYCHQIYGPYYL